MPGIFSVIFTVIFISQPALSAIQYCDSSTGQDHVELVYGNLEKSNLDTNTGAEVAITTNEVNFGWHLSNDPTHRMAADFDMLYTIMDFEAITPMTNGHLHTWDLSLNGIYKSNDSEVVYRITPALSVSSNVLKHPDLINGDSFQLKTALLYKTGFNQKYEWIIGFMSDHRFGDYLLYPVTGVCWQPADDWLLQLALPDFSIRKTIYHGINLLFYAAPEGNQWNVYSKDRQLNSDLTYNAITTGISVQWEVMPNFELSIDYENQTRREFSIVLDDNVLINPNAESTRGLTVRGEVLF